MTEAYQVPKDHARVTVHPPGIETEVFLSRDARLHGGHETISDLVADPQPFLPTQRSGEDIVLLRKEHLSWVRIHDPLETEETFFQTSGYAHREPVRLTFVDGSNLNGSFVAVSPEPAARASDIANRAEGWLHFEDDENHYLVNLQRASRIDVGGEPREES